jgi:hypothetical protein
MAGQTRLAAGMANGRSIPVKLINVGKETSDAWSEADHPRDPDGQFTVSGGLADVAAKASTDREYADALEQFKAGRITQSQLAQATGKVHDFEGADLTVYRVGNLDRMGRGVHFGDSPESIAEYKSIHPGEAVKEYRVSVGKTGVTRNHMTLHQHLFGKNFQDAVWRADKASGMKSSIAAADKVEQRMAAEARRRGYEAIVYTSPPLPAKHELVLLKKGAAKLTRSI